MLPTFFVIGARKSGTTSLWRYMQGHPGIFVPENEKEPKYFVEERGWQRGQEWYESLFAGAPEGSARGDLSTDYSIYPVYSGVPKRIAALIPDARLIYVMRDPIEHMRSAYAYSLWLGTESRPIREALLLDARYSYECLYALQIEQYLEHFPLSQMLLLTAEDLRFERRETMRRIFSFIGVDPDLCPDNVDEEYNVSRGRRAPRAWARLAGDVLIRSGAADRVPPGIERAIGRVNRSKLFARDVREEELQVDDDLRSRLAAVLRRDLSALRAFMGPSFTCWGLLDGVAGAPVPGAPVPGAPVAGASLPGARSASSSS